MILSCFILFLELKISLEGCSDTFVLFYFVSKNNTKKNI